MTQDMGETVSTPGGRRRCGVRQPGAAYLALPLAPGGRPVEEFLVDPPQVVSRDSLGLSAIGVTLVEREGVTHVLDIVGREHYPTVASFIEELRRMGVSRRISRNVDFARLGADSRLVLLHEHADIANALEFPSARRCPCEREEHLDESYREMCARLWADEPLEGAAHRLGIFAVLPIAQIEVVRDPASRGHIDTRRRAAQAALPVVEVDR